ncbi:MAG TPA: hypothetical protein VF323_00895 [Candidatus Limnocylindrales bacterium]
MGEQDAGGRPAAMDDPRWEPGMPALDRQPVRERPTLAQLAAMTPRSVPETAPTPLQRQYINLSAVALVLGVVAISALELGSSLGSPLVKLCVAIAGPILLLTTGDATLRIARSARAWMAVDAGRGWFRVAWVVASCVLLALIVAAMVLVLRA